MKRPSLLFLAIAFSLFSFGQDFKENTLTQLPDTLAFRDLELADIDNDSLLDVILFSETDQGVTVFSFLRNDGAGGAESESALQTNIRGVSHYLTDLDGDNQIDVILSGQRQGNPVIMAFLNRGNFSFEEHTLANFSGTLFRMADLDGDGIREMLVTGKSASGPFLRILQEGLTGWETVHDSIAVHGNAIESFDFDSDNDLDFFISGVDQSGSPVAQIFYNQGHLYFTIESVQPLDGVSACSDVNHDGLFDILLSGKNSAGDCVLRTLLGSGSGFHVTDSLMEVCASRMISADFDSDGSVDLQLFGTGPGNDTVNIISRENIIDTVKHQWVRQQTVGDFDRDGDLDLAQLWERMGTSSVVILLNETGKNQGPGSPLLPISARIFNRIFLSWNPSTDDHTPAGSVTYDVSIQVADDNLVPAGFDFIHGNRLLVSHGNNLSQRYALIRNAGSGPFFFMVQSVDNSFHAGRGGICKGSGDSGCLEMETTAIDACSEEVVILKAESKAEWFSFREGFLGETVALSFLVEATDTLFSVEAQGADCAKISVYTIQMKQMLEKMTESTRFVCEGEKLRMRVQPGWASTEWSSSLKGFLSAEDSIEYTFTKSDTLQVVVANGNGCEITHKTILNLSKPDIDVTPEAYQIMKGESVRLSVTGGNTFEWRPAAGLDDPFSPTPLARPDRTTEYVVIVRDSLGCQATGGITVIVEETAFIPNLFTPNNDGSNDVLKIYGLGSAKEFSFAIYNREGVRVYQTGNLSEAVGTGWNGTSRGVDLPAGVYFWKVSGQTDSGKNLLLNGKNSGSIVLLR